MDGGGRYESQLNCLIYLEKPGWKSQTIQTFFQGIDIKYFAVIESNPRPNNSDKMNLLDQMLESAKLKDKEAQLERDIIREESGKTENSPWDLCEARRGMGGQDLESHSCGGGA